MVTAGASLFQRAKSSLPARLRHEERTSAEYTKWVAHELAGLTSVEQARAASNTWTQRPRISVIMVVRNGETVREGLESLSCMYMGHLLTIRWERFLQSGGLSSDYGDAHLFDLVLRLADETLRVCHITKVLYHGLSPSPALLPTDPAARAITNAVIRREQIASNCVPGPGAGTFVVRRKRSTEGMTAIICSKSPDLLETCLVSLRATADRVVRQIVAVAHEECGLNPSLRSVIKRA